MKAELEVLDEQEPMGIVISRGPQTDEAPTFSAYMWAPDPEAPEESGEPIAA